MWRKRATKNIWANYCGHFQAFTLRHGGSQIKGGEKWIVLMMGNSKSRIHAKDFTANHRPLWFIAHLIRLARISHDACFPPFPLPGLPTPQPCQGQPEEMIPLHHKIYKRFTPVCLPVYRTHRIPAFPSLEVYKAGVHLLGVTESARLAACLAWQVLIEKRTEGVSTLNFKAHLGPSGKPKRITLGLMQYKEFSVGGCKNKIKTWTRSLTKNKEILICFR